MNIEPVDTLDLTVILPVRWSAERSDVPERLAFIQHDDRLPRDVRFLVVDDGSEAALGQRLRAACEELGFLYHRIESTCSTFSIGRARNVGVQQAGTRYVMFQDIDLMPYPGFYQDVLNEIVVQGLDQFSERFLMFGVIYLTEEASAEYLATPPALRRSQFTQHLFNADRTRVEKFSTGTSVTVWSRDYFLGSGGNDPDFEGWGYEDLEFMCRAIRREKRFPLPHEFSLDYKSFQAITEYRGWKSIYRLYGDMTFQKGQVLFHAWHPVESKGSYAQAKDRNRKLFEKKLHAFATSGEEPSPLPMPERGRTVMFRSNPWVYNRWVAPYFGEITIVEEDMFDVETFAAFVQERGIDRIVFHNPYVNETMLSIYRWAKATGKDYLVCERGALPGSVFFDALGFNGESGSYAPSRWRRKLSGEEDAAISNYIRDAKMGVESLEEQPDRIGPRALRKKLKLSPTSKILFVPLQRPSDTVIQYLIGPVGSYDNFISTVRRLVHTLPPDWSIVVKRHPLETVSPELPGVVFADDAHVNDLIEMSEAVFLINSGVGLAGMMFEKPVLHAGQAFYGHEGLARQASTHEEVLEALKSFAPDRDAIKQFLHYLVFEFYSFAHFTTHRVAWADGALMTATKSIDYLTLRLPGKTAWHMEGRQRAAVGQDSVLFDRYRGPDGSVLPVPAKSSTPAANRAPASAAHPSALAETSRAGARPSPLLRKLKKLQHNPVMFLRDSQFSVLRSIGQSITPH